MRSLAIGLTILLSACIAEKAPPEADTSAPVNSQSDTASAPPAVSVAPPASTQPAESTQASTDQHVPPKDQWVVNFSGIGEVRAGMTVKQVNALLNNDLVIPSTRSECEYMRPKTGPKGVSFLFEKGTLSAVSVKSGTVKTLQGIGIGDSEKAVDSAYKGLVVTQSAKYTSGHRLIVTPKDGGNFRLVFETDGAKVTQFVSGREPAVEYVEGCG
jgi:hypothetical protein